MVVDERSRHELYNIIGVVLTMSGLAFALVRVT
jgi:hypothetical protein